MPHLLFYCYFDQKTWANNYNLLIERCHVEGTIFRWSFCWLHHESCFFFINFYFFPFFIVLRVGHAHHVKTRKTGDHLWWRDSSNRFRNMNLNTFLSRNWINRWSNRRIFSNSVYFGEMITFNAGKDFAHMQLLIERLAVMNWNCVMNDSGQCEYGWRVVPRKIRSKHEQSLQIGSVVSDLQTSDHRRLTMKSQCVQALFAPAVIKQFKQ